MTTFSVSIIIPVYNAERFIEPCVKSALALEETGEVLLVEDRSTDKSLEVCKELQKQFKQVKLLTHPQNENRGAGASRNLGIEHSSCEFIAFLDADDYYLPNRFKTDKSILLQQPEADGTYNAMGTFYESEEVKKRWLNFGNEETMTLTSAANPRELPLVLLHAHPTISGSFSTNTITVRRSFLDKVGRFNEQLRLRQDIHMWFRMSVIGNLFASEIAHPVAMRRVHTANRMTNPDDHAPYADIWWQDIGNFITANKADKDLLFAWRRGYCYHLAMRKRKFTLIYNLIRLTLTKPTILAEKYKDFDTICRKAFGHSKALDRILYFKNCTFK